MKNPVRTLVIAPTPFFADRGCHVHIAEQAWALQRQGHKVLITTYGLGRDLPDLSIVRIWRFPWYRKESIGPSWHKFYLDIFLFFTSLRAAWRFRPDVIHAHLHEGCLIGWAVGKLLSIPVVFDCQGSLTGELIAHKFALTRFAWMRRAWYRLERWIDHRPSAVIAQSTEMRRELHRKFRVPQKHIFMAYDGVNTTVFTPNQNVAALRGSLGISSTQKVVVYLGGLTRHKGADTLLEAFQIVQSTIPDTMLLLMGYPNESHYRTRATALKVADKTIITGRIAYEDAPQYLGLGDVAVAPKRTQTEANGKIYNYMASGLPTVAFDTVVNRDILGDLGVYVDGTADVNGLAMTLIRLLEHEEELPALREQVRNKAVKHYSWDAVAGRIVRAYEHVMVPWQLQVFALSVRKKEKWLWVARQLRPYLEPEMRCLDVGSGVGTLSILQERMGGQWDFTETDAGAAAESRHMLNGPVHEVNIFDTQLKPGTYHLITVLDVIEHVPNPVAFLKRLHDLLAPNGRIVLTTPADDGGFYFWRRLADRVFGIDMDAHGHEVEGFSLSEIQRLTDAVELRLVRANQFSYAFTEMVELLYNGVYIMKNRRKQQTGGYNLALSPASGQDVRRHFGPMLFLRIVYPLLRGFSLLDRVIPLRRGYEWGVVITKDE